MRKLSFSTKRTWDLDEKAEVDIMGAAMREWYVLIA